jgi:hypothetical protein
MPYQAAPHYPIGLYAFFPTCRLDSYGVFARQTSTGISLLTLAFGFSLRDRPPVENDFCVAGSAVSVLAGMVFLAAACIYRRQ